MKKPAYYKEGVPYDVRGQVITALSGGSTQAPLVTDLGGGKFQFASQGKACYLMSLSVLGSVWVMDRNDGYGVAACFATEDEKRAAVSLLSGLLPAPKYTPELLEAAMRLLGRPDVMALNSGRWGMQFAVAGRGVMLLGEKAVSVLKVAISRAVTLLTASTAGPMVAAASTLLFSAAAGQGSDRVPGRDREAMLALNAKLLSQNGVKIAPGSTSVDLPVRGSLVYRNGQLALELLKTGDGVPKAVRVLMAERDEATGLDRIRVPSVAGEPERTILINPVAPPAKSSSTGNDEPAPVTPKHTGTDITPVESITVTTTPVDDHKGLQDFIYWRPDADGTGVEPVYVVLSNLGGNAAKGTTSTAILTSEMETKILAGQRISGSNKIIGGHSPNINDANIIDSIRKVGDSSAIGQRLSTGETLHRGTINGVEIDVIIKGNEITAGYPVGGKPTPGFGPVK